MIFAIGDVTFSKKSTIKFTVVTTTATLTVTDR